MSDRPYWCEICARKKECYGITLKPKCFVPTADRKTENCSEKPNNCKWSVEYAKEKLDTMSCEACAHWEHGAHNHYYCALLEMRQECCFESKDESTLMFANEPKDEPQTDGYMTAEQAEDYRKMLDKAEHKVYGNIEDEPTWEQVKEYCNKRCLDIVDSAMRKQWYKDEPYIDIETGTLHWCGWKYKRIYEDEPQTERYCTNCKHNGVIEDYECRECNGMDKHEFIESQTDCPWK